MPSQTNTTQLEHHDLGTKKQHDSPRPPYLQVPNDETLRVQYGQQIQYNTMPNDDSAVSPTYQHACHIIQKEKRRRAFIKQGKTIEAMQCGAGSHHTGIRKKRLAPGRTSKRPHAGVTPPTTTEHIASFRMAPPVSGRTPKERFCLIDLADDSDALYGRLQWRDAGEAELMSPEHRENHANHLASRFLRLHQQQEESLFVQLSQGDAD